MVMIKIEQCREIAAGKPDVSSVEFRNAVKTMGNRLKIAKSIEKCDEAQEVLDALLAHGAPVQPRRLSHEEISTIRRDASAKGLVARCKASLMRKLGDTRKGFMSVTDRKLSVFDAALEIIEDGQALCIYQTEGMEDGKMIRRVTIATKWASAPSWTREVECRWKSRRRQEEEDRI